MVLYERGSGILKPTDIGFFRLSTGDTSRNSTSGDTETLTRSSTSTKFPVLTQRRLL